MHTAIDTRPAGGASEASMPPRRSADRPAARALRRASGAGLLLGLLGLASFVPIFARLIESWRVSPGAASHHISILGQHLSYPVANAGAVIIVALSVLGGVVTAIASYAIATELRSARRLARRLAGLNPVLDHGVFVIDDERVEAFCAGLLRPRVYITRGALARLDEAATDAVLMHERHHARRRDPLRLAASRVLVRSLFFLPAIRELRRRQQVLVEIAADENAVGAVAGDRSALARAMLSFSEHSGGGGSSGGGVSSGIHPVRVDYLLGEAPRWRFPALTCVAAAGLLALLVAVAILVGREAAGSATLAPPFLSAQPCIVMLALIPCGAGLVAVWLGRVRLRGRTARDTRAAPSEHPNA